MFTKIHRLLAFVLDSSLPASGPVVHKIWLEGDGNPIPAEYQQNLHRLRPLRCRSMLWSDAGAASRLVEKHQDRFPRVAEYFWKPTTTPVMRSDMLRLLILWDQGGIYSDHDMVWSPFRWRFSGYDLVFWTEFVHSDEMTRKHMTFTRAYRGDRPEYNVRVCNCVCYAKTAGSRVIARCLETVQDRLERAGAAPLPRYGVLYTTGPDAVTDSLIMGLPNPDVLRPFDAREWDNREWIDREGEHVLLLGKEPGRMVARHLVHGAWSEFH